ncbi:MAG: hypothetical protein IT521_07060 [Burkholderiales bacterium]|nr:hypothetical protein [Burkholderiales bacterium]
MIIRRLVLPVVLAVAMAACTPSQPEFVRPANSPSFPPTQFVDVLEAPPTRPYEEIGVIEVPGEPGTLRTQVLAQIRGKAQAIGANAVILQDKSRTTPASQRLNPATGQMESTGGQVIPAYRAVAIRYK